MKKKRTTNIRTTLLTLCFLLGMMAGLHAEIPVISRVILSVDDPTVTADIDFATAGEGEEEVETATLTLSGMTNKTAVVTASKGAPDGADINVSGSGSPYTFTMPADGSKVYVNVVISKDPNATYAVTTKVVGVASDKLTITGASNSVQVGTSVTVSAAAPSADPSSNSTISVAGISALSADGTFFVMSVAGESSITFNMPASPVEVTIESKSVTTPVAEVPAEEVYAPVITIPAGSEPSGVDDISTLYVEVVPVSAEDPKVEAAVKEVMMKLPTIAGNDDGVIILDISLKDHTHKEVQPTGEITITIPYPEGTTEAGHNFRIIHVKGDGTTDFIIPRSTTAGLQFEVSSLSPFVIGYTSKTSSSGGSTTIPVKSITLNKTTLTLKKGDSETLVATILPEEATDKYVIWYIGGESVATVDANGKVTAVAKGSATIIAMATKAAFCEVTVTEDTVTPPDPVTPEEPSDDPVTGVSLDKTTASLEEGATLQLAATVKPSYADDKSVRWKSSDEAIATVNSTGLVTALTAGTCTITVTTNDGDFTATCTLTVSTKPVGIDPIDTSGPRVYTSAGMICIDSPSPVDVTLYSGSGALLRHLTAQTACRLSAPKGFYIVRVNNKSYKIIR